VHATASVGITLFPDDAVDADLLIQHGDTAMYQAKNQGKDRFRFFTRDMNRALLERASLEAQLRKALDRDEFLLHYQPRVALDDGRVTSVEALARWPHPERGWIPPDAFIVVAEDSGLIGPVGRRLLELACAQARRWVDAGTPIVVAFNLSARQLQERDVVEQIERVLAATGLDPAYLEVELTESAVMRNVAENVEKLGALRALGVQVSIDDFGTAYSSLNYLKRLPATALKIDRSFVADVGDPEQSPHDAGIVRAIVALARTLELTAIAEGIETPAQLAFLRQVGCEQGQGFLLGRPVPADELHEVLARGWVDLSRLDAGTPPAGDRPTEGLGAETS
jgi:diguanylate cyclase